MNESFRAPRPRRPLREDVRDIDRDILHLLLRRHNILKKMRNEKGLLDPAEEKFLREGWEAAVSRVSRDARLSSRMFVLMQEVDFLPRPEEGAERRRPAFNLAPPAGPVRLDMTAPLDGRLTCAWMFLSALAGAPVSLAPCLMNDLVVDGVKLFNQLGGSLNREDDGRVAAAGGTPASCPDKVLHVGSDAWLLHLVLALYLGRPSRAKLSGGADLRLGDLSAVRRFLPEMGARLTHVVPRSEGLPARVECSGLLPDRVLFPADAPIELAEGIALAASTYERPLVLDLSAHPERRILEERVAPLLRQAGAPAEMRGAELHLAPGEISVPAAPAVPMEPELALHLLALAPAMGGRTRLGGIWPRDAASAAGLALLKACGARVQVTEREVVCAARPLTAPPEGALEPDAALPDAWMPLPAALAALAALRGGEAPLPRPDSPAWRAGGLGMFSEIGLDVDGSALRRVPGRRREGDAEEDGEPEAIAWNAPSPGWAMALALAACGRPAGVRGFRLGNPGVVMGLHPAFWALYNGLPEPRPAVRRAAAEPAEPEPAPAAPEPPARRRRVIAAAPAVLPPPRDPDDE